MAEVNLRKVVKRYDDVEAVRGIDLDISDKEFIVLVGPSGCGKSTTLRMIAGLEDITDGDIMIGGTSLTTSPPIMMSPSVMSSSPAIIRSVVDLPQPDGPTSTMNS